MVSWGYSVRPVGRGNNFNNNLNANTNYNNRAARGMTPELEDTPSSPSR